MTRHDDPLQARPQALITGASSGIGAAFARELASEGYDLVLTARRETQLESLGNELRDQHGIAVTPRAADLTTRAGVETLVAEIEAMPSIDLLVNNAGFGTTGFFSEVDLDLQMDMVRLHVDASVRLTHAALARMMPRAQGSIVNVSSIAAFVPRPGNVTYAATKAYLNTFSSALAEELRGTGIRVQALCPGFTTTEFHDSAEFERFDRGQVPRFVWMSAEDVARASLRALERGQVIVVPGRWNRLIVKMAQNGLTRRILLHPRFRSRRT